MMVMDRLQCTWAHYQLVLKKNIVHFLFNNYSHESVGGHDTSTKQVNFSKLAQVLGYKFSVRASNFRDLEKNLNILKKKTVVLLR